MPNDKIRPTELGMRIGREPIENSAATGRNRGVATEKEKANE